MKEFNNIKKRKSVRTYDSSRTSEIDTTLINKLLDKKYNTPFNSSNQFKLIDITDKKSKEIGKMSSYGMIKGANYYIAGYSNSDDKSIIDYGYSMEQIILDLNNNDLGSCWLGGTFNRNFILKALNVPEDRIIPAITPVGYEDNKKSFTDKIARKVSKADYRLDYDKILFNIKNNKLQPLQYNLLNNSFKKLVDSVRFAPSASNKQPWRLVISDNRIDLLWDKDEKYNAMSKNFNIQALDMGIAICHLERVLHEENISYKYKVEDNFTNISDWNYVISLIINNN